MKPAKRTPLPFLHVDIRFLIYEHFFSSKTHHAYIQDLSTRIASSTIQGPLFFDQLSLGTQDVSLQPLRLQYRLSAHTKISLLLVNKTIYAEALPFFHHLHTFHMALRRASSAPLTIPAHLPLGIRHSLGRITRLELLHDRDDLDSESDINVAMHLGFVRECCPSLTHLTVDIAAPLLDLDDQDADDDDDAGPLLDSFLVLQELWPRLSWLRICMLEPFELFELAHRDFIARDIVWCYDGADQVSRGVGEWDRACFVADRGRQEGLKKQWRDWKEVRGK